MIDGNLAVKADEPDACAWATCQWGRCKRGRFRLVAIPGVGKLWLCRLHVDERRRRKRPAVKVREHDDLRACEWPEGCNRRALSEVAAPEFGRLRLCRRHAQAVAERSNEARATRAERTAPTQTAPSAAAQAALRSTRGRSVAVTKESIPEQAAPSPAAVRPAVKPEPSPGIWSWLAEWGLVFAALAGAVVYTAVFMAVLWVVLIATPVGLLYLILVAVGLL